MSNIFRRYRAPTGYEYYDTSVEIANRLTHFLMNDKNVPKSYRQIYAIPIINLIHELRRHITAASSIYPVNDHELERRRDAQQDAINTNEAIIQALQDMLDVMTHIDVDKLDVIGELLTRESALLRGWRKSSRVISS